MGKKHPLDVFRSSAAGFESASRERRTLLGRVVASAPRGAAAEAPAPPPAAPPRAPVLAPAGSLPPVVAATRDRVLAAVASSNGSAAGPVTRERIAPLPATRPLQPPAIATPPERRATEAPRPRRPAPAESAAERRPLASRINRALLVSACVLVGGLALWTLASSFGGPSLKSAAPVTPAAPAATYHVLATTYPGTPAGESSAFGARDLLRQQGFTDVEVMAWPGSAPDSYSRFDLVVGKAGSEAALGDVAKKLRGLKNWPGAVKQPFKDAAIQATAK